MLMQQHLSQQRQRFPLNIILRRLHMLEAGIPGLIIDRLQIMFYTQVYFDNVFGYSVSTLIVLVSSLLNQKAFVGGRTMLVCPALYALTLRRALTKRSLFSCTIQCCPHFNDCVNYDLISGSRCEGLRS